jgi:hypothetical protein
VTPEDRPLGRAQRDNPKTPRGVANR